MGESTARVLRRPLGAPGDIEHPAALGVLPAPLDDRLLDPRAGQGLGRGLEPGPDERAGGTESQGRGHAPPVGDPARGQDRRGGSQVHHDRHEGQRGPAAAGPVAAGFGALGHDDIGTQVHGLPGLLKVGDLDDQRRARLPDEPGERAGVAERQHHGPRPVSQRALDWAGVYRPALETYPPGLAGALGDNRQLTVQPVRVPVAPAEQAQPSAVGDRRGQGTAGRSAHGGQRDGVPQREHRGECGRQRHNAIITLLTRSLQRRQGRAVRSWRANAGARAVFSRPAADGS